MDINLNPSTQLAILRDVVEVLNRQGIKKLLIFNSHGGNNFKPLVRELGLIYPEMFICFSNWFQSIDKKHYFDEEGDHADELETSLILYLRPELVLPKAEWGSGKSGVGNPMQATKEKGELYFKDVTVKIGKFISELCNADLKDLYE